MAYAQIGNAQGYHTTTTWTSPANETWQLDGAGWRAFPAKSNIPLGQQEAPGETKIPTTGTIVNLPTGAYMAQWNYYVSFTPSSFAMDDTRALVVSVVFKDMNSSTETGGVNYIANYPLTLKNNVTNNPVTISGNGTFTISKGVYYVGPLFLALNMVTGVKVRLARAMTFVTKIS